MRILIVGAGGVGGYLGARLARRIPDEPGLEVHLLAREGPHRQAIQRQGLTLETADGPFTARPTSISADPRALPDPDVVLLAVKAQQLEPLLGALQLRGFSPGTLVFPLQNGIGHRERVARALPAPTVVAGSIYVVSMIGASPGLIVHKGNPARLTLGIDQGDPRIPELAALLVRSGVDARATPEIDLVLWNKFLFVCPFSIVPALLGKPLGDTLDDAEGRAAIARVQAEILALAEKEGVALGPDAVAKANGLGQRLPRETRMSLQRDLEAGRDNELDAFSGEIVRRSKVHGLPAPESERIHRELIRRGL
jgi:2-dehydropantoate 2-reductase